MASGDADPFAILRAWDVPAGAVVERTRRGTNNRTWIVRLPGASRALGAPGALGVSGSPHTPGRSGAGDGYVLRLYENTHDRAAIAGEHRLLAQLTRMPLSFAVPAPIAAAAGETLVPVSPESGAGRSALAALFPLIPGEHPTRGEPAVARACGATLAELDAALARLSGPTPPQAGPHETTLPETATRGTYGDLDRIHPLVPDPFALPEALPGTAEDAARLRHLFEEAAGQAPALYAALPRQIIHSDFGTGNVLMAGGLVTGVLDFEFASLDLRAMDWAVGLLHSAYAGVPAERRWDTLDAFGRGYAGRLRLRPAEARALPALLRLRRVVSLIHRAGRWRQGVASTEEVLDNLRDALALHDWLRAGETRLIERALSWQETP